MSGRTIVSARAFMTNGHSRVLTHAPLRPGQAREVVVPRRECLSAVSVQLNNGHTLKATHLDDCRSNQLVVGNQGIDVFSADVLQLRHGHAPPPRPHR